MGEEITENSGTQPLDVTAAIEELTSQWGYRDITALMRRVDEQLDVEFEYLCVLQEPDGSPVYCRHARRLSRELNKARAEGHRYDECPAPNPEDPANLWMVVGNFDCEEDQDDNG